MEYVVELLKFIKEKNLLPEFMTDQLTFSFLFLSCVGLMLSGFWKVIKAGIKFRNRRYLNKNLSPYFSSSDVRYATRYYIPTKFQNVSPSEDEEPGKRYLANAKQKLMPVILKKILPGATEHNKHYIILADTGMGKTTFLINLYLKYKNQLRNPFQLPLSEIYLFPLGAPDVLEKISEIPNKSKAIILLDAFDEDIEAIRDYSKRLKEILRKVNDFEKIIITCRTQFFPSRVEEPYETGFISAGEFGPFKFQKIYISVFDDRDIFRYLRKKYSLISPSYYKARIIAKSIPNLVVRPMLLSYIDEFLHSKNKFHFTFQIYQVLINRWITRESSKFHVSQKYSDIKKFKTELSQFLFQLSWNLYEKRVERGGYYINEVEDFEKEGLKSGTGILLEHLTDSEKKSRSLLNRNAEGKYKFSHKSILEYFLTVKVYNDEVIFRTFDWHGMNSARTFFLEMSIKELQSSIGYFIDLSGRKLRLKTLTLKFALHVKELWLSQTRYNRLEFPLFKLYHFINLEKLLYVIDDDIFYAFLLLIYGSKSDDREAQVLVDAFIRRNEFHRLNYFISLVSFTSSWTAIQLNGYTNLFLEIKNVLKREHLVSDVKQIHNIFIEVESFAKLRKKGVVLWLEDSKGYKIEVQLT